MYKLNLAGISRFHIGFRRISLMTTNVSLRICHICIDWIWPEPPDSHIGFRRISLMVNPQQMLLTEYAIYVKLGLVGTSHGIFTTNVTNVAQLNRRCTGGCGFATAGAKKVCGVRVFGGEITPLFTRVIVQTPGNGTTLQTSHSREGMDLNRLCHRTRF